MDSSDSSYYSRQQLDELFLQMIAFFSGDPKRIQHFMKVHSFARIIGTKEGLDETSLLYWKQPLIPMTLESVRQKKSMDGVTESCRSRKDRLWHRECFPMWELKII